MYQEVLRAISGIEVYPVVSLVLFVAVFSFVLIRTARLERRHLETLAALPLDPSAPPSVPVVKEPASETHTR
jgi:hypothetical protein